MPYVDLELDEEKKDRERREKETKADKLLRFIRDKYLITGCAGVIISYVLGSKPGEDPESASMASLSLLIAGIGATAGGILSVKGSGEKPDTTSKS